MKNNRLKSFSLRRATYLLGSAALLALSACDSAPEGQVVAVVNGDEITAQELNGELSGVINLADEDQEVRNAALEQVLQRRLLAQIARDEGIASSPDFILRRMKLEENLLVEMLNERLARDVGEPTEEDIDNVIEENPQAFAERTLFAMDQIVFRTPGRDDVVEALAETMTMEQVVTVLNRMGVDFRRSNVTVDSATLPPEVFAEFNRIGSSEPIIIPSGQTITVQKILATRDVPLTGEQARPVAANAFVLQATQTNLQDRLEQAREAATIEYQSGYGTGDSAEPSSGLALEGGEGGADDLPATPETETVD